ncbi:vesicle-associated membrane protein 2-like [Sander vitreus]
MNTRSSVSPRSACRSTPEATGSPGGPDGEGGPPAPAPNLTSNRRLQQTQAQVDEVVDIMRVNVDKVLERDQKLSELDDRADALQAGASQFESSAAKLKNKYWWKNCKHRFIQRSASDGHKAQFPDRPIRTCRFESQIKGECD